jgi:hypothetical protein
MYGLYRAQENEEGKFFDGLKKQGRQFPDLNLKIGSSGLVI